MSLLRSVRRGYSAIQQYRFRGIIAIALSWTIVDYLAKLYFSGTKDNGDSSIRILTADAAWSRLAIVFSASALMAYLLVFKLRIIFREYPLWKNLLYRTGVLMLASIGMNVLIYLSYALEIWKLSFPDAMLHFWHESTQSWWLLEKSGGWMFVFLLTQLLIEVNEKYAPGVFASILLGKYVQPRQERRIVLFLDLKDSTPIAEQLGNKNYFLFIREFIFHVSMALLEYRGNIYQYVGDEIVASWKSNEVNAKKAMFAIIEARRTLQQHSEHFKRKYGVVPEFRAGLHEGELTIGEIGVVKKDLAMSGDTMNTAARIRTATSEQKQKLLVSKEFLTLVALQHWQSESIGSIELKGKSAAVELFTLKI